MTKTTFQLPQRQTFTTSDQTTYSYIHIPASPRKTNQGHLKPTLLFLHGFPSHLEDWTFQIEHFAGQGYGVVAPDLLGYGRSSKSDDVSRYRLRAQSDDVAGLLDHLFGPADNPVSDSVLIGVGHDTGATLLSRLAHYYPSRLGALVFLAVGPPALGTPFDVDAINAATKPMLGFEMLGYVPWIAGREDSASSSGGDTAQATLERHAESAMSLMFAAGGEEVWNSWFRPAGRMRAFVSEDRREAVGDWYPAELRARHLETFGRLDGYRGATLWYRMWLENLFAQDEVGFEDVFTAHRACPPTLFVTPRDPPAMAAQQEQMLGSWASRDLSTVAVDSGHWVHLERREETNQAIESFLVEKLGG